ncbi:hypothetical protein B0H19DRAFT_964644 [Mycena capillaripes]|nr:hypothetical protein B0H19DRAFT_964644 [Mycena capillaripes]
MKLLLATALLSVICSTLGKPCNQGGGECVAYFNGANCQSTNFINDFVPTCAGNCFQFDSFSSLSVVGNGIFGTDCHVYSDINCQHQIADTGNDVFGPPKCVNVPGAKSMKCFYHC